MEKISIGILGYNEEYGIAHLLDSLREQTLLHTVSSLEVIVISNGSKDNTAAVARTKLATFNQPNVHSQVIELPIADKCSAWNHFIHAAAQPADCYIFLDADVVLVRPESLEDMVQLLADYPECRVVGGKVINCRGELKSYLDGKCYVIRGEIARNLYIPNGIVADDVYIFATAITNWYETTSAVGMTRGYAKQTTDITVRSGSTPRDRDKSYWIACRKRSIMAEYTQKHIDYCMRSIFGGGELAKTISMKLFATNPNWFMAYLQWISLKNPTPEFHPPEMQLPFSIKKAAKFLVYCYCYLLSIVGIRNREFGHLAWKLKSRYW